MNKEEKAKFIIWLRYCLTGNESSPSVDEIMAILGKEKTLERLNRATWWIDTVRIVEHIWNKPFHEIQPYWIEIGKDKAEEEIAKMVDNYFDELERKKSCGHNV